MQSKKIADFSVANYDSWNVIKEVTYNLKID